MIRFLKKIRNRVHYIKWILSGEKIPVDHMFKQRRIINLTSKYNCKIFVETGTYYGQMVEALQDRFDKLLSVELFQPLFQHNLKKFSELNKIHLYYGDSSERLPEMLENVNAKALFWLDGHYSGEGTAKGRTECPVISELGAISQHYLKEHVILIDDARCFDGTNDYPTIDELKRLLYSINSKYDISISHDCIIALPPQ